MQIVEYVGEEPKQGSEGAAAVDLKASETKYILPGEVVKIKTGTKMAIPENHVGILTVRSSLGARGIMLANGIGVIDSDYRGNITFALYNANVKQMLMALSIGPVSFDYDNGALYKPSVPGVVKIEEGERIGQLMIVKLPETKFLEVEQLDQTSRGEGGFGSTGE